MNFRKFGDLYIGFAKSGERAHVWESKVHADFRGFAMTLCGRLMEPDASRQSSIITCHHCRLKAKNIK